MTNTAVGAETFLYRFWDRSGALLYVGIASNPGRRLMQHMADKPWADRIASQDFDRYPSRASALAAEREAIQAERPRYNVVHNGAPVDVVERNVAAVEQIRAVCSRCGWVIPPRCGYLELDVDRAYRCRDVRQRADDGLGRVGDEDWSKAPWVAWCNDCKMEPEGRVDVIELATVLTWRDLPVVANDVMAKRWGPYSNWLPLTSRLAVDGEAPPLRVYPSVEAAEKASATTCPFRPDRDGWAYTPGPFDGERELPDDWYPSDEEPF